MRVLQGRQLVTVDPGTVLTPLLARARRVVLDIGTGDARAAHRLARAHPDWLVVGVDPAWRQMTGAGVRSRRRPERGGSPNLLLVHASVEALPAALTGLADEVLVVMPWGSLLRGVVRGDHQVWSGLRTVARTDATLAVTIGTRTWRAGVPEVGDLPEPTPEYVRTVLADRVAPTGWRITGADLVTRSGPTGAPAGEATLDSSWAKRLDASPGELVSQIRAVAVEPEPPAGPGQPGDRGER